MKNEKYKNTNTISIMETIVLWVNHKPYVFHSKFGQVWHMILCGGIDQMTSDVIPKETP